MVSESGHWAEQFPMHCSLRSLSGFSEVDIAERSRAEQRAVAHGLLFDGSPYGGDAIYGCWLIFRLCLLPLFPHRKELGLV
jgi:hypothetical protein